LESVMVASRLGGIKSFGGSQSLEEVTFLVTVLAKRGGLEGNKGPERWFRVNELNRKRYTVE